MRLLLRLGSLTVLVPNGTRYNVKGRDRRRALRSRGGFWRVLGAYAHP